MGNKIILIMLPLLIGCKRESDLNSIVLRDTIFIESNNHVDTLWLKVKKSTPSIWMDTIIFSKKASDVHFIIGSSLSHNNYITISNVQDSLDVEILGTNPLIETYKFKNYEFIVSKDSTYNSGILTKIYFTYLINRDLSHIYKERFEINSNNDGKSYDKEVMLVKTNDTIYLKYKE